MSERPIDIWNEMTTQARITGRCMFCEAPLYSASKRPVICTDDECRKTYHRLYRHMVREPREQDEPAEVARVTREERNARKRELHALMPPERRAHFLARCKRNRSRAGAPEEAALEDHHSEPVLGGVVVIVMPANSTGWFWHSLARETGRIGHLYSPRAQTGPFPWFPYALDNGAFSCWTPKSNYFDDEKWESVEGAWQRLIVWAECAPLKARWAIVPDVPGNAERTFERWERFAPGLTRIPRALAVQDGMTPADVAKLRIQPEVICVGGSTEWKWENVAVWAARYPRVHLLRCNSPAKLYELESMGIESCDGTEWLRGDKKQTSGLEEWARSRAQPHTSPLWPYTCKAPRVKEQESFA